MSKSTCCVVHCKNNGSTNSALKFYRFPTAQHKLEQRRQWIAAVNRKNSVGSPWTPNSSTRICSAHFINNEKSDNQYSSSYIPKISPHVRSMVNVVAANNRFNFFMKKYKKTHPSKNIKCTNRTAQNINESADNHSDVDMNNDCELERGSSDTVDMEIVQQSYFDKECQVYIEPDNDEVIRCGESFTCAQYFYSDHCDVSTQTDIYPNTEIIKCADNKKFKNKKCGTDHTICFDADVQCNLLTPKEMNIRHFQGLSSITSNEQLIDIAGVHFDTFHFLLKMTSTMKTIDKFKVPVELKLLIFLVKFKTGMTFSAMSVFFSLHRTTVSKIFFNILLHLEGATKNIVFWPSKDAVLATMPDCFKPDYENTRVILDCTELRIDIPGAVDNKVFCYSTYKKGFTAKVLIGITPSGFISFKSRVAGGRKSDSQITIESGLLDLLEDGDVVMSDKGFPEFKTIVNNSGKKCVVVMPPFLKNKEYFSKEETEETYSIARVRIYVERIMQRLRTYGILNKIHSNLFPYIDAIVHVCCCLVNLQPPIIAENEEHAKTKISEVKS